jgi:hypothetical protein
MKMADFENVLKKSTLVAIHVALVTMLVGLQHGTNDNGAIVVFQVRKEFCKNCEEF